MIRGRIPHQLYLADELSKRLAVLAKKQKRTYSDLLIEMIDLRMNRRAVPQIDDRIASDIDEGKREAVIICHSFHRFVRHQLLYVSPMPVHGEDDKAQKRYDMLLDSLARMPASAFSLRPLNCPLQ